MNATGDLFAALETPAPAAAPATKTAAVPAVGKIGRDWKIGDEIVYRSMWSGCFIAKVVTVRYGGEECDCDVFSDGGKLLMTASRVPIAADYKSAGRPGAYKGGRPRQ